mmetsp:Transcript_16854/g.54512  ORF Transcript_16854/g.54512 Transcript_16854/m.54512 type:complete len:228 (+) Transcript_16854:212-895(+)
MSRRTHGGLPSSRQRLPSTSTGLVDGPAPFGARGPSRAASPGTSELTDANGWLARRPDYLFFRSLRASRYAPIRDWYRSLMQQATKKSMLSCLRARSRSRASARSSSLESARAGASMATYAPRTSLARASTAPLPCSSSSSTSPAASASSGERSWPSCSIRSRRLWPMRGRIASANQKGATIPSCVSLSPIPHLPRAMMRSSQHAASRQPPAGEWPSMAATVAQREP